MLRNPLILSQEHVYPTNNPAFNNHTLVISPSGGGKTVSFVEPNLLYCEDNLILRVSKRALVDKYKPFFRKKGYQIFDLNLAHPEQVNGDSISYDPMARVLDESGACLFAEQIMALEDGRGSSADPFWQSAAAKLLLAIMYLCLAYRQEATFADVLNLFYELEITGTGLEGEIETTLDDRFKQLEKRAPNHEGVKVWKTFSSLPFKTAGCVYSSLATVLQIFSKQTMDAIRTLPTLDVTRFCARKSVLFITANATDSSRFKISNLLFEDLLHNLIEEADLQGGALKRPTRLIIDDFAVAGTIDTVPTALSFVREAGISLCLMCQSVSQLETLYGHSKATTIKNNCDSTVYIGAPNDIETANEMSLKLNRPTAEMLALKPDQAIVCRRGCAPVMAHRYRTLEDPVYTEVTEKFARARASAVRPERRKRKDFSPLQGARESLDDFAKEVDHLAAKFDKRYKSLLGGSGQTG